MGIQENTGEYKGIHGKQGSTRKYKGKQENTGEYKGIHGKTGEYKGIQENTGEDSGGTKKHRKYLQVLNTL